MNLSLRSTTLRELTPSMPLSLTPGPLEVSPTVLKAAAKAYLGHRTPAFRGMLAEIQLMLLKAFEISPLRRDDYAAVLFTGSGTSAMEAMAAATAEGRRTLTLVNGRFSRRMADIAAVYSQYAERFEVNVGDPFDSQKLDEFLARRHFDVVYLGIQDTREATLNPVATLAKVAKRHGATVCVDAISAMIGENVVPDVLDFDFFAESSGKAIRGLPGLGIVVGKRKYFEEYISKKPRTYYLDLWQEYEMQSQHFETRFAPAVHLVYALQQALLELMDEGIHARRDVIRRRTERVRTVLHGANGLSLLRPASQMPHSVTSFLLPAGVEYETFQSVLQERWILVYAGSSVVSNCFQIGTAGYLTDEILDEALTTISDVLTSMPKLSRP